MNRVFHQTFKLINLNKVFYYNIWGDINCMIAFVYMLKYLLKVSWHNIIGDTSGYVNIYNWDTFMFFCIILY